MVINKIKIKDFNLYIGKNHILKNINCAIPEKKITVIIGSSGCGKTTLLKSMNRLNDLNKDLYIDGQILLNGNDIYSKKTDVSELRRKMGLLLQRPSPLPLNIFNNVAYGLKISGRKKRKYLDFRVEHYLKQASLWDEVKDRLSEPAGRLSIGQQQRLCLARGLAVDPELILGDEPTSALDPISTQAIEKKLTELKKSLTIVVVTHTLRQAKRIADHVIFMYMGEIIEQGPAYEFFERPVNSMSKRFLAGSLN